jgi:hypothetical protein
VRAQASQAERQRDEIAQQAREAKERIAVLSGERAHTAEARALGSEIEALRPQADAAQALLDAVHDVENGRSEEFARVLAALGGVSEPGLWLTGLTVSAGGKRVEMQGEARNGASVLRYARRANEKLRPLTLRVDNLEMQPTSGGNGAEPDAGVVSFHLY